MIIIVEGVDRAGKTTIANAISAKTGIPVFKNVNRYANTEEHGMGMEYEAEKVNTLLNLIECIGGDVILDRFHISELVYGLVDREYFSFPMTDVDGRLADDGAVIVYVKPDDVERCSKEHGSALDEHAKMFDDMIACSGCTVVEANGMDDIERVVNDVEELWKTRS